MALINAYVDAKISGNKVLKVLRAFNGQGARLSMVYETAIVGATDSANSVYRLFKSLNNDITLVQCNVANTSITGGTSYGLGLYYENLSLVTGTAVNYFSGVMDMSAAAASIHPKTAKDGLAGLTPTLNIYNNRLFEHAGQTIATRTNGWDFCLTATTPGTSGGTICVQLLSVDD